MKHTLFVILSALSIGLVAQPKGKEAKMAPVLVPGYYVGAKGDTVKGEIMANPNDVVDFYAGFSFKPKGAGKVAPISSKKAKGYGFEGRHFICVPYDEQTDVYLERIVNGRLKFYERKVHAMDQGNPVLTAEYYIQDTRAEDKEAELKEIKPISTKKYKNDLKPYMKEQIMTWNDLDKYTFNREAVIRALQEFNKFYDTPTE